MSVDDLLSGKFLQPGRRTNKRSMEFVKSKSKTSGPSAPPDTGRKRRKKSEASTFKADLNALHERDPEFYAYLKQTDSGLLDFTLPGSDEEEDEVEDEVEDAQASEEDEEAPLLAEHQEEDTPKQKRKLSERHQLLSAELLTMWCSEAKDRASLRAMRNLLKAFRVACHCGDSDAEVEELLGTVSGAVLNKLIIFMLREASAIFRALLDLRDDEELIAGLRKSRRWHKVEPLLKSFLGNALHLLGHATSPDMQMFTLRTLRASVPFLGAFQRLQRKYVRATIRIFGSSETAPRVQAFLFVRHMAATLPQPATDQALKGVYRAFVRNAKFMTPSSAPHVAFMGNCVVELFGLDMGAAYEHAFVYIRELAALLRGALSARTKDAFREVYCWQTVNTLELWAKLLAAHHDKEELRPLVYPLAQVLTGAVRLLPTPRYFPLHLRLLRALVGLGAATRLLLPVTPLLLDMLRWAALHRRVRAGSGAGAGQPAQPQGVLLLRASKASLATAAFQQDILEQVLELLAGHMAQWACSVAYPELAHVPMLQLRRFAKKTAVPRFSSAAKALVAALEANCGFVEERRRACDFAPKDTGLVQAFLSEEDASQRAPLQVYAKMLHEKVRRQRALQGADEVRTQHPGDAAAGAADEHDAAGEEEIDVLQQLQEGKKERRKEQKKQKRAVAPEPPPSIEDDGEEDQLEEYELSE